MLSAASYIGGTMKEMSEKAFQDRIRMLQKARKIFIESGLTKNISIATEAYLGILAEQKRDAYLSSKKDGNRPRMLLDNEERYNRPTCPDCRNELSINVVECGKGIKSNGNRMGWKTRISHDKKIPILGPNATDNMISMVDEDIEKSTVCLYERYSKKSIFDWEKELRKDRRDK